LPWVSGCRSVMLSLSAIIFPRIRTSFISAAASSFSLTWQVPHRAGLPSFSLTRASSRRTSLQLLVAQAMRITVSLIAPRSYHETGGLSPRLPPGQALGGASYAHHRRIHVIFRTCNPIPIGPGPPDLGAVMPGAHDLPAECDVTHHVLRSNPRSRFLARTLRCHQPSLAPRLGAARSRRDLVRPSSSIHSSPPCAHAPYWWKDGVPHEDSISVAAACRCSFRPHHPHCTQRHRGAGLLIGGLAQRRAGLLVRHQLARADRRRCHLHHALRHGAERVE
jgi:hypothetical protein